MIHKNPKQDYFCKMICIKVFDKHKPFFKGSYYRRKKIYFMKIYTIEKWSDNAWFVYDGIENRYENHVGTFAPRLIKEHFKEL